MKPPMSRPQAFTLIELLVVISIIALLIGILLPALGAARRTARQLQNSTQVRGIHQGMVSFAQGNKGWFPGVRNGKDLTPDAFVPSADIETYGGAAFTTGGRFAIMLEAGLFGPEYCISPAETDEQSVQPWDNTVTNYNDFNTNQPFFHSFALLQISGNQRPVGWVSGGGRNRGRFDEWSDTLNSQAVVISDRLTSSESTKFQVDRHTSLWSTGTKGGDWGGSVTYNDGHTGYLPTSTAEAVNYAGIDRQSDNLFAFGGFSDSKSVGTGIHETAACSNAYMVALGNSVASFIP